MKKLFFTILGFSALILALGAVALWQMPKLSDLKPLQDILPKEFPKMPSLTPKGESTEFISADGKFKADYPANWATVTEGELLEALVPAEWAEKYNLQAIFLAQNFWGGEFTQMVVYKGTFDIAIEEIFKKMQETNEANGWTVEVLESSAYANEGIFEGRYKNQAGTLSHSKEKILINGKEAYWVSFFALEKDWQGLEETIDKILKSATI